MRARGHEVTLAGFALDHDCGLALLVGRIRHHVTRQSGDFVHFFMKRDTFLEVLELDRTADFGQDRESVRVPLDHYLSELDWVAFVDLDLGAVDDGVALALAALLVNYRDRALAIHDHQVAGLGFDRLDADKTHGASGFGFQTRLFGNSRCRTADVEGTHGELGSRFTDGLGSDDSGGFAKFHEAARSQVAAVAHNADAALGLASEHGADFHPFDTGSLNRAGKFFRDLLVDVDDHIAVVVLELFERHAAHKAIAQCLDDFAAFDDTRDVDAVHGAAVVFADDYVLGHVDEPTREVAGVGGLERRIGQTFSRAVGRDEILQHG